MAFNKSVIGTLTFQATAEKDTRVILHMGERRNEDQSVHKNPGRSNIGYQKVEMTLLKGCHHYVVKLKEKNPEGYLHSQKLAPHYPEVMPFRYAEITAIEGAFQVHEAKQAALFYYFDETASSFSCSDENLMKVWDLCKYTQKATPFLGVYCDGNRERMPYEADAYIQMLSHFATDREYSIARYTIQFLLDHASWPTEWQMHMVLMAWEYYMQTGDTKLLEERYEDLKRKSLITLSDENGLISTRTGKKTEAFLRSLNFPGRAEQFRDIVDWPQAGGFGGVTGENDGYVYTDYNTVVNAFHNRSLVLMARIAGITGNMNDVTFFSQRAKDHRKAFNAAFLNLKTGIYRDGEATEHSSLHANMFPLAFDLVPGENLDEVTDFVKSRDMACSVYGSQYLLEALYKGGEAEHALSLMSSRSRRSWLNMLRVGSTMTTEAWDEYFKPNLTWNHAWGSAPANICARKLMGIEALQPTYSLFRIAPQPGKLREADIRVPTIRGPVEVGLINGENRWIMEVSVPGNAEAELWLPADLDMVSINGRLQEALRVEEFAGGERAVFSLGSGKYKIHAAGEDAPAYDPSVPEPTLRGIPYGEHERHILDFWKADSETPTPLVFVVHGGGWIGGEKERLHRFVDVQQLLDAGISVAAINYRLMKHAGADGITPPVKAPMHDAARALQFVRSRAADWNIDKRRIGAAGGSAGACTSLWLAFHEDLAKPDSRDPLARESSRLWCAAVIGPQTSLDPEQMKEWIPNSKYGAHAFGKENFEIFLTERESILPWIREYSPYELVSPDDPPVYLYYKAPPVLGREQKDPTHSANFGVKLQERCEQSGTACELVYPGAPSIAHESATEYLISTLKKPNVLFIAIDDLRPELGCYGAKHIHSPHMDRLASEGVLFSRAYCQAPHCGPSRSSLLTGIRARRPALHMNVSELAPGTMTLPEAFRRAGYYTMCNGKITHQLDDMAEQSWSEPPFSLVNGEKENNHLTWHDPESAGYILEKNQRGPFFESPEAPDNTYIDGQTCEKTIRDLRSLAGREQPFFMACGFVRPHLPFYAPRKYWDLYDREHIEIAGNRCRPEDAPEALKGSGEFGSYHNRDIEYNSLEFHRIARHGYYACVSYADALVGRLLNTLDVLGLRENTIVVLWGDHGWNLGEHSFWSKHNLLHTSKNAPLIISAPGYSRGAKNHGIVELTDLYPTLCKLAGIDPPEHLEGISLVPLLRNPEKEGKEAAYTFWREGASVTTRDFSYTEYDNGEHMLFDLRTDPAENINVAGSPLYGISRNYLAKLLKNQDF